MAIPIQDTPVLSGEYTRQFIELINNAPCLVTLERNAPIKATYNVGINLLSSNQGNGVG